MHRATWTRQPATGDSLPTASWSVLREYYRHAARLTGRVLSDVGPIARPPAQCRFQQALASVPESTAIPASILAAPITLLQCGIPCRVGGGYRGAGVGYGTGRVPYRVGPDRYVMTHRASPCIELLAAHLKQKAWAMAVQAVPSHARTHTCAHRRIRASAHNRAQC